MENKLYEIEYKLDKIVVVQLHGMQHFRLPCPSYLPEFAQIYVRWVGHAV